VPVSSSPVLPTCQMQPQAERQAVRGTLPPRPAKPVEPSSTLHLGHSGILAHRTPTASEQPTPRPPQSDYHHIAASPVPLEAHLYDHLKPRLPNSQSRHFARTYGLTLRHEERDSSYSVFELRARGVHGRIPPTDGLPIVAPRIGGRQRKQRPQPATAKQPQGSVTLWASHVLLQPAVDQLGQPVRTHAEPGRRSR